MCIILIPQFRSALHSQMNQYSIANLNDVLSGKMKLGIKFATNIWIKLQDIKHILAPQFEELTADKIYLKVKGIIYNLSNYFP